MSSRIFSAGLSLLLSACGAADDAVEADAQRVAQPVGERVACALGAGAYADDCTIERAAVADGTLLTIRHPDGGFRRLRLSPDGRIREADGALPARVLARSSDGIEVAVGEARYRLPLPPP